MAAAKFAADGFPQQGPLREEFGIPTLRPVQRTGFGGHGPPLIVGGTGDRVLRLAGEYANIIGVAGALQLQGQPPGTMRIASDVETDEQVRFARACAGYYTVRGPFMEAFAPVIDRVRAKG